jgi:hypothetical protein
VRALVRRRQPRRAAAAQAHCTSAYALSTPEEASTVLPASRAPISDPVACEHPIPHKRKAVAEVAVDTEALVCSGLRCSSP